MYFVAVTFVLLQLYFVVAIAFCCCILLHVVAFLRAAAVVFRL